ncbi:MAG: T9SS type A sorting domain-containing protein, partial [Bacteroidales bacterium]|nr:T9SS type A sorting domain-containing protein [Bacteroidales bacterium]
NSTNNIKEPISESLTICLNGLNSSNKTYINFNDKASFGFDSHIDAYKLFGWAEIAQVYSEINDVQYSINCLSHSTETISVPLCISIHTDEELSFDFIGLESFNSSIRIDLEDLKTGNTINIRENPAYAFFASTTDSPNRFKLHFNGATEVNKFDTQAPLIYALDNQIHISSGQNMDARIMVYNINGQLVGQAQMKNEIMKQFNIGAVSGVYMVNVQAENAVYSQKVFIK